MNRLSTSQRAAVVRCLVEGNSIRSTVRITGVAKNTITKLLIDLGEACSKHQDATLRNLPCKRLQLDEIWTFCHAKSKNLSPEKEGVFGFGDVWTWTAIDAETKLVPSFLVGPHDGPAACRFVDDLAGRLAAGRVQVTTDGLKAYLQAVDDAFGSEVDYAMLIKLFGEGSNGDGASGPERRYSPGTVTGTRKDVIQGAPDLDHVSTSYVERQNLTMRMSMRRFTRLTNAFSKKVENLAAAVALHFMYYNFARPHQTLTKAAGGYPTSPAMAAGVTDRVWTVEDIAGLLDGTAERVPWARPNV